jgi:hypothetical protein
MSMTHPDPVLLQEQGCNEADRAGADGETSGSGGGT